MCISQSRFILLLACGTASLCSAASITYNVNLTIGTASVTGTITTDGTIGELNVPGYADAHVVDWNLLLNDPTSTACGPPVPCMVDLQGPWSGSNVADGAGTDLLATATQMLFNFSGTDFGFFFFAGSAPGVYCFGTATGDCLNGPGETIDIDPRFVVPSPGPGSDYQFMSLSGTQVIGTATGSSTPEPSTLCLLGAGIALLGFGKTVRRRHRGRLIG